MNLQQIIVYKASKACNKSYSGATLIPHRIFMICYDRSMSLRIECMALKMLNVQIRPAKTDLRFYMSHFEQNNVESLKHEEHLM